MVEASGAYGGDVSAVVLAAGAARRFGGGKLLAEVGGRPLIHHALLNLADAPVGETIVVVGAGAEGIREACKAFEVRVVENPEWAAGQSTSVRAGILACGPEARAVVVLLGDQPFVGKEAIKKLIAAFEGGARVAVATYGGRRRNPVLFAREAWPLLVEELSGDEGARSVLRRHPGIVVEVPCDGVAEPTDVDTREDLENLGGMHQEGHQYKIKRKEEMP
ncbi:MAG: Molybdenum cofactor cytidylyltransferase [uncultured Rubrobacteraceae bacterium]|uniref:Molybdenum cofactor cytidylyltransferase n=1 Tax=uncultured Rubrobacteraceae bacterium TaxID=349277 RepID=A0A6J4R4J1_9ACTN|nr:MAG: Molybdenum cofactor cytidylyltransferase [uncultured Rubrobacteraceae bacterium]